MCRLNVIKNHRKSENIFKKRANNPRTQKENAYYYKDNFTVTGK